MREVANFIGGEFTEPAGGAWLDNMEPATGEVLGRVAASDAKDVAHAVEAAHTAFPGWSGTPAGERSRILLRLADLLEENLDDLAHAESVDTGKPVTLARTVDIPRAVLNVRFFATAILHTSSESHATDGRALNYTLRGPRGVTGLISPWNLPLYLLTWKVAPAIATGNTAVAKPSELSPVTAAMLAGFARDAGLPPGVLNVVQGRGARAGAALVEHPEVGTISFTGGTVTGAAIARAAAPRFAKLTLELGGKNPTIVFADADLDAVVATLTRSAFANQGQICLCGSRILVEERCREAFLERFVRATRALRQGDPLDPATEQGAVISEGHFEKVMGYIELARKEGGAILAGGRPATGLPERCRNGWFIEPTIVTGLGPECRVNQEEIFGPVVTVQGFSTEDEAIRLANDSAYGLAASVWTSNLTRAHRVAGAVACGTVWVNCWLLRDLRVPFGGMKQSGVGREGGEEAIHFFTESKNVCVALPAENEAR